jgi:hypothetical protein
MHQQELQSTKFQRRRWRLTTGLLIGGCATTWLVAAVLVRSVMPILARSPALSEFADEVRGLVSAFGLTSALVGVVVLAGLALVWLAPETNTFGRVFLLVAGLVAIVAGLLLLSIGTFDLGWVDGAAVGGMVGAAGDVAVGLLACVASLSRWLPGESLVERMMLKGPRPPAPPAREGMLPLTAALVVGWVGCTSAVLANHYHIVELTNAGLMLSFLGAQWGMPILSGAVVAGWRAGEPNRLQTLGLSALAGIVMDWLFLLTLMMTWYYGYQPLTYPTWWGAMGAIFGAAGYGLWSVLAHRSAQLHLRPH